MRGLLADCDQRTAKGSRDFAILTLLARLGLHRGGGGPQPGRHRLAGRGLTEWTICNYVHATRLLFGALEHSSDVELGVAVPRPAGA